MTGTVGILSIRRRMPGPTPADQREYLHPAPREHQCPSLVSQRSIHRSFLPRAAHKKPSRLLSSPSRFRPSIMALSRRCKETPFQLVHIHLCNKHTVPARLLQSVHTNPRLEPYPSRSLPVKPWFLTLTRSQLPHHPPLDRGETLRKCDAGQGRGERLEQGQRHYHLDFLGLNIPFSLNTMVYFSFCYYHRIIVASWSLLLCSVVPQLFF